MNAKTREAASRLREVEFQLHGVLDGTHIIKDLNHVAELLFDVTRAREVLELTLDTEANLDARPGMIRRLFLGGPWHGQTRVINADARHYVVTQQEAEYVTQYPWLERSAVGGCLYGLHLVNSVTTGHVRGVMVAVVEQRGRAQHMLTEHLVSAWIDEAPDR